MNKTLFSNCPSPLGELLLTTDGLGLTGLFMSGQKGAPMPEASWERDDDALAEPAAQLAAYFAGDRTEFTLPLAPRGTAFQRQVWEQLRAIPYGETISYGELARRVGNPNASRAVGAANGRNPIGIIVPCHRVIGSNGALTGYGGGLPNKKTLLAHEAEVAARRRLRLI